MLVVCVFPQVDQSVTPQYSRNSLTQYIEANSIFTIREVGVQDTGIYTCTAQTDSLAKKDMKKATMVIVHGKRVVTHMRAAIVTHTHGVSLRFWTWIRPSSKLFFFFFFWWNSLFSLRQGLTAHAYTGSIPPSKPRFLQADLHKYTVAFALGCTGPAWKRGYEGKHGLICV